MVQNDIQNDPKIDLWALGGRIFEILGGFEKHQIWDEFSIGEKSEEFREIGGLRLQKGVVPSNFWEGSASEVAPVEGFGV